MFGPLGVAGALPYHGLHLPLLLLLLPLLVQQVLQQQRLLLQQEGPVELAVLTQRLAQRHLLGQGQAALVQRRGEPRLIVVPEAAHRGVSAGGAVGHRESRGVLSVVGLVGHEVDLTDGLSDGI
ncbi:hypothetical protein EYF80_044004 [Liparis tanakae]|uniref:Uncharacterized protein n=1 Tax=Liparis tanakae TaxID=230148 RepID=A0A4Z2FZ09_9TELE|nr:hypothetical protein EYF80_044004 [Liparis tanakae]